MLAEDEDLGNCDRIKPSLDPAPDRREEGRCANDLFVLVEVIHPTLCTHEYSIERFWIMCRCQHTRILHVGFEVPKLCKPDP